MAKLSMHTQVALNPADLWDVIGKFNALSDWHPGVESSKLESGGRIRRLKIAGGGEVVERLEAIDRDEHLYRYSIVSGPIPVMNYVATLRVRDDPETDGSTVEWSCEFEPAGASESDAMSAIQSAYQAGFDNLKKMFGG